MEEKIKENIQKEENNSAPSKYSEKNLEECYIDAIEFGVKLGKKNK